MNEQTNEWMNEYFSGFIGFKEITIIIELCYFRIDSFRTQVEKLPQKATALKRWIPTVIH